MKRKNLFLIAALALIGLITVAAASQSTTFYSLWIKYNRTSPWLINTQDSSGATPFWISRDGIVTLSGIVPVTLSGATITAVKDNIAYLGGTTSTVPWTYQSASGVSPTLTTWAGTSGWFLTSDHLATYRSFYVDPSGGTAGASPYTHGCPTGLANSGATVYFANSLLTSSVHGLTWKFTNQTGTTGFVLYAPDGRINGGTGTTQCPAGESTVTQTEDAGDTVEIQAIYTPISVSGWYVRNVYVKD